MAQFLKKEKRNGGKAFQGLNPLNNKLPRRTLPSKPKGVNKVNG